MPFDVNALELEKSFETSFDLPDFYSDIYSMTSYDDSGNIGKRYRRSDITGTPFALTIDDETLNNDTVTIRDRDTMEQVTLKVSEVVKYIEERIKLD